jgi:transcription elongation factor Elf1
MPSEYIIQKSFKSYCPDCHKEVDLLCTKNGEENPWFYICWSCKQLFEVGKGKVTREEIRK